MSTIQHPIDLDNVEFTNAWNLIKNTHQSVFLTGKAGTGKSTFLKYICQNTTKKYIVLAPTGIAAVNVGGMTLHSFFKIPFKPLLPDDIDFSPRKIRQTLKYPKNKVKLIKELELIIIDEISMVRADIIDFIDKVLRIYSGNMREPFGGKQLLLVGDVFQLEPVVTPDMRELLSRAYRQFYFFNAAAFNAVKIVPIELRRIYRQTNPAFISILDRVRINKATNEDLRILNSRLNPDYKESGDEFIVTLATRRDIVDVINEEHLKELPTQEFTYIGEIEGTFPAQNLPTSLELTLKRDAQVLFIRNDKENRWINGTIGKISVATEDYIKVQLENGEEYSVEPEVWENMQYTYDEKAKRIKEVVLGTFKQYPIKPAWALTVHKSQGLTFNNIIIDFTGGAFSCGQTYVALSRCTSLQGIVLKQPIRDRDIIVNYSVVEFSKYFNDADLINNALVNSKADEDYRNAAVAFDDNDFRTSVDFVCKGLKERSELDNPLFKRFVSRKLSKFHTLVNKVNELEKRIKIQNKTLKALAEEYVVLGRQSMEFIAEEDETSYGGKNSATYNIGVKSAIANYDKALLIYPQCADAWLERGKLYLKLDKDDEAEESLLKAAECDKACFEAYLHLGKLYLGRNKTSSALKFFKKAVRVNKKSIECHNYLVSIYEKLDMDELADKHKAIIKSLKSKK